MEETLEERGGGRGGMSCSIFSSKVITFSRKNSNFVLLGQFCEFINKSDTSGNTLNSKFSRGFLWDKIFLVDQVRIGLRFYRRCQVFKMSFLLNAIFINNIFSTEKNALKIKFICIAEGHSTTTWTKFLPILTTYSPQVDNCGYFNKTYYLFT